MTTRRSCSRLFFSIQKRLSSKMTHFLSLDKSVMFSHGYYFLNNYSCFKSISLFCHFHRYVNTSGLTSLKQAVNVVCPAFILTLQVVGLSMLFKLFGSFHFAVTPFLLSRDIRKDRVITCSLNGFAIS